MENLTELNTIIVQNIKASLSMIAFSRKYFEIRDSLLTKTRSLPTNTMVDDTPSFRKTQKHSHKCLKITEDNAANYSLFKYKYNKIERNDTEQKSLNLTINAVLKISKAANDVSLTQSFKFNVTSLFKRKRVVSTTGGGGGTKTITPLISHHMHQI